VHHFSEFREDQEQKAMELPDPIGVILAESLLQAYEFADVLQDGVRDGSRFGPLLGPRNGRW
jgi:hypothetical protein